MSTNAKLLKMNICRLSTLTFVSVAIFENEVQNSLRRPSTITVFINTALKYGTEYSKINSGC